MDEATSSLRHIRQRIADDPDSAMSLHDRTTFARRIELALIYLQRRPITRACSASIMLDVMREHNNDLYEDAGQFSNVQAQLAGAIRVLQEMLLFEPDTKDINSIWNKRWNTTSEEPLIYDRLREAAYVGLTVLAPLLPWGGVQMILPVVYEGIKRIKTSQYRLRLVPIDALAALLRRLVVLDADQNANLAAEMQQILTQSLYVLTENVMPEAGSNFLEALDAWSKLVQDKEMARKGLKFGVTYLTRVPLSSTALGTTFQRLGALMPRSKLIAEFKASVAACEFIIGNGDDDDDMDSDDSDSDVSNHQLGLSLHTVSGYALALGESGRGMVPNFDGFSSNTFAFMERCAWMICLDEADTTWTQTVEIIRRGNSAVWGNDVNDQNDQDKLEKILEPLTQHISEDLIRGRWAACVASMQGIICHCDSITEMQFLAVAMNEPNAYFQELMAYISRCEHVIRSGGTTRPLDVGAAEKSVVFGMIALRHFPFQTEALFVNTYSYCLKLVIAGGKNVIARELGTMISRCIEKLRDDQVRALIPHMEAIVKESTLQIPENQYRVWPALLSRLGGMDDWIRVAELFVKCVCDWESCLRNDLFWSVANSLLQKLVDQPLEQFSGILLQACNQTSRQYGKGDWRESEFQQEQAPAWMKAMRTMHDRCGEAQKKEVTQFLTLRRREFRKYEFHPTLIAQRFVIANILQQGENIVDIWHVLERKLANNPGAFIHCYFAEDILRMIADNCAMEFAETLAKEPDGDLVLDDTSIISNC